MGVNQLDLLDCRSIVNELHAQATGQKTIAPVTTADFVSMATTALGQSTDTVYGTLMSEIGRTIFSVRPYDRKFGGLVVSSDRWGAIRRKINYADKDIQQGEQAFHPVDGQSVDHWKINKSDVVETRYYGSDIYQDSVTVFETQLRTAFDSEAYLSDFISGQMTAMSSKWEQYLEEFNRSALVNFIAAKYSQSADVVHLLTDYASETGVTLTDQTCWQPSNLPFWRWVRARINTIGRRMSERSELYQMPITGHHIMRHTPASDLRIYMLANILDQVDAMVNTITYHDEPLAYAGVEGVSYWQDISNPDEIQCTPVYIDGSGAVQTAAAQTMSKVVGVMFDRDAIMTNIYDYGIRNTPLNAAGLYYNSWLTARVQVCNDLTEKAVVLMLD